MEKIISNNEFNKGLDKESKRIAEWIDKVEYPTDALQNFILDLLVKVNNVGYYELKGILEEVQQTLFVLYNSKPEEEE